MPPDVQFNENRPDLYSFKSRSILGDSATPGMARLLMKWGIVKSEKIAGMVLVAITVLSFGASIYFFFFV